MPIGLKLAYSRHRVVTVTALRPIEPWLDYKSGRPAIASGVALPLSGKRADQFPTLSSSRNIAMNFSISLPYWALSLAAICEC